jgi:phospholipid transport system transporter-binding protein
VIALEGDTLRLDGPIVMANVGEFLREGSAHVGSADLTVDLSAVTEVDSSALALLLEWRREAVRKSRKLNIRNLPVNLRTLAEVYGVVPLIGA